MNITKNYFFFFLENECFKYNVSFKETEFCDEMLMKRIRDENGELIRLI